MTVAKGRNQVRFQTCLRLSGSFLTWGDPSIPQGLGAAVVPCRLVLALTLNPSGKLKCNFCCHRLGNPTRCYSCVHCNFFNWALRFPRKGSSWNTTHNSCPGCPWERPAPWHGRSRPRWAAPQELAAAPALLATPCCVHVEWGVASPAKNSLKPQGGPLPGLPWPHQDHSFEGQHHAFS